MPLKVHFLNVGRGDCTIIEFPSGRIGIVDIDNLSVLDPDTRSEVLQEYHESFDYIFETMFGSAQGNELDEKFIQEMEAKLTDPLAYYDAHIGYNKDIFRFIVTHPDKDHMTGLYRLHEQDGNKSILNFWHTGHHDFNLEDVSDEDWGPYDKRDWDTYKKLRASTNDPKSLQKYKGRGRSVLDGGRN